MKNLKTVHVLLILMILYSCNSHHTVFEFYEGGAIKSQKIFSNEKDKTPFMEIRYFKDGVTSDTIFYNYSGDRHGLIYSYDRHENIERWATYSNDIRNGFTKLLINDSLIIHQWYKDGLLNCVERRYLANGVLLKKLLWLDDELVAYTKINSGMPGDTLWATEYTFSGSMEVSEILEEHIILHSFYEKRDGGFIQVGDLSFKKNGELFARTRQNFVIVNIADTIVKNESLNIEIEGLFGNLHEGYQLYVLLEIINNNSDDKYSRELISERGNLRVRTEIEKDLYGYNLIIGRAILFKKEQIFSTILFYKDIFVMDD